MAQPRRTFESIRDVVAACSYPGFDFKLATHPDSDKPYLQIICEDGVDTKTGEAVSWKGRKWDLSYYATDTEIVQTAWAAVQRALIHEASEMFKFKDAAIYDRHISVHRLVDLIAGAEPYDSREDAMNGLGEDSAA
ncbi:hypothetical protein HOU00_gp304 [Caulobacter phage CcrPW]|uniref:Uncharacterized protein n=1 Tax=Caulobacter phage CcrPW TaxID=2283271 RepID=A0A385EAB0_9CAUD|nr:hypothetical protein HOU00_gp304 [Caulobacter phage CcrPW]AXQ68821.1 hypothetical protein CcrPW_gp282 [Caulobacter phage CcrPW]